MSLSDCKRVTVTVHKANDLPKADAIGKVDAYVAIFAAAPVSEVVMNLGQTQVIKKDYDPEFNEKLTFNASEKKGLRVVVYDWDKVSSNDIVAEVTIPFEECSDKEFDLEMVSKTRKNKKKSPTVTLSVEFDDCEEKGLFALYPSLKEADLDPHMHGASNGNVHVIANLAKLTHQDGVFLSLTVNACNNKCTAKLLRTSPERTLLARFSTGGNPLTGTLTSMPGGGSVCGKSGVYEMFELGEARSWADISELGILLQETKIKKQESMAQIAPGHNNNWERHKNRPGSPEDPQQAVWDQQIAAFTKAHTSNVSYHFEWHHNKEEPHPLKALAGISFGGKSKIFAETKIVTDKADKYLGDVVLSGKKCSRTLRVTTDTKAGGIPCGQTTTLGITPNTPYTDFVHLLIRLKDCEVEDGDDEKDLEAFKIGSFAKF